MKYVFCFVPPLCGYIFEKILSIEFLQTTSLVITVWKLRINRERFLADVRQSDLTVYSSLRLPVARYKSAFAPE